MPYPYVISTLPVSPEAGIHLDGVTKRYGDPRKGTALVAVDDVTLDIPRGCFFSLLGPSGCGKTTLLRMVAGFERPDAGRIEIVGEDVTDAPPQDRPTALVFQNYALFPTMTAGENVAYGLEVKKWKRPRIRERVAEALGRVDLSGLEDKPVSQLSGGQQQRVALARALAVEPDVLLFDEPLSNLDLALREETRRELKDLQHELGTTSLYVTHDQQEALALSDLIAVMHAGWIVEVGPPETLYITPETAYVARFLGGSNVIEDAALIAGLVPDEPQPEGYVLSVRPGELWAADEAEADSVPARLLSRLYLGAYMEWTVEVEGAELRVWMPPGAPVPDPLFVRASTHHWVRP
jgi:ABC-type Fe3+/spermidine/putrescine transport system ATPase subunit